VLAVSECTSIGAISLVHSATIFPARLTTPRPGAATLARGCGVVSLVGQPIGSCAMPGYGMPLLKFGKKILVL